MGLDRLNEIANERFEAHKRKQLGIPPDKYKQVVQEIRDVSEDNKRQAEKFEEMQSSTINQKIEKKEDFIDKIDALGLSSELSLAVSFIVIAHHEPDKKVQSIKRAVMTLEDEIN